MSAERLTMETPAPYLGAFDMEQVDKIRQMGQKLISPFWALSKLGISYTPKARDLILAKLSQTTHGNEIHFIDTKRGVRFYADNIDALLAAEQEIYTQTMDFFPKRNRRFKIIMRETFRIDKAEPDWRR